MKKLMLIAPIFIILLVGCGPKTLIVRELDDTIIEAAEKAKAAGAAELSVEVAVVSGYKGTASIPTTVVTFGVEKSLSVSTKFTAKVDLTKWSPPLKSKGIATSGYFILDTGTMQLQEIK